MEQVATGEEDEDGSHSHDGLGYASAGVEGCHERKGHPDERAQDGGNQDEEHAAAVANGCGDCMCLTCGEHNDGETKQAYHGTHEGAGEGHNVEGFGRLDEGFIVRHADLAENQPYALSQPCSDAE